MIQLKTIKQEKNPFLKREEFLLQISSESVPSYEEIKKAFGKDDATTVIKKINTNFGRKKFLAEVLVYDSKEAKEKVEVIPKKIRKKLQAEKKAAEEEARKKAKEEAAKPAEEGKAEGENE